MKKKPPLPRPKGVPFTQKNAKRLYRVMSKLGARIVAKAIGLHVSQLYRLVKLPPPKVHASTAKLVRMYLDDLDLAHSLEQKVAP